jgi:DNA (cytosine-5)-methyltransferase 1
VRRRADRVAEQSHDQRERGGLQPWISAAECLDWALPTYSIFLTREEGRHWGVKRPLADNTMRRVARGFDKFVLNNPRPFIVGVGGRMGQSLERFVDRPMQTITGKLDAAICTPIITEHANATNPRSWRADEPLRTVCAQVKGGHFALVAPFMVPRYGEDPNPARGGGMGQAPRARSVAVPMPTIVPSQNGAQLVAAFLAKHNGGHEATGQMLDEAMHTLVARDNKALVTSSLVKLKGTCQHGQQLNLPLATVQAGGLHYAETRAFLVKYYGAADACASTCRCRRHHRRSIASASSPCTASRTWWPTSACACSRRASSTGRRASPTRTASTSSSTASR